MYVYKEASFTNATHYKALKEFNNVDNNYTHTPTHINIHTRSAALRLAKSV